MNVTMEKYVAEFISSIIRLPDVVQIVEETHRISIEHLLKSILTGISLAARTQREEHTTHLFNSDQKLLTENKTQHVPSTSNRKLKNLNVDNNPIASYTSPESDSDTESEYEAEPDKKPKAKVEFDTDSDTESEYEAKPDKKPKAKVEFDTDSDTESEYEAEPDKKPKAKVEFDTESNTDSDTESEYEAEPDKKPKAKFNEDLTTMAVAELKAKCKSLGLPVSGTKQKLIQRLESSNQTGKTISPEENLEKLPLAALKEKCRNLGLPVTGTKQKLIQRLGSSNQTGKTISPEENLEKLPLAALKEKCRNLGLPVTGTKQKLIQRLQAGKDVNLDQDEEPQTRSVSPKKKSPEKKTYAANYGALTVNELKNWCKRLGLKPVGNKQELIDRIAEYKKNETSPDKIAEYKENKTSPDKAVNYRKNQTSSETDTSADEDDFTKLAQNTKHTSGKDEYFFGKHLWNL